MKFIARLEALEAQVPPAPVPKKPSPEDEAARKLFFARLKDPAAYDAKCKREWRRWLALPKETRRRVLTKRLNDALELLPRSHFVSKDHPDLSSDQDRALLNVKIRLLQLELRDLEGET